MINFGAFAQQDLESQIYQKEKIIQTLKDEIAQIDSEMKRCKSSKKKWIAATVIGGAGVVATGTAAIVQGVKLSKQDNKKSGDKKKEEPKQ